MPDTETLTEEQLKEIEALSAKVPEGPWFASADDAEDVPDHRRSGLALVDTGRSADWWIARLCEWHTARFIAESKTNIDALCRSLRAAWAENERLNRLIADATVTVPWEAGYSEYVPTAGDPVRSIKDLIAHIRERGNSVSESESSVTFWKAEALLEHFCSEHASNERQKGHYCTICAKPFVMTIPQGERPPKYKDLIAENAALRTQNQTQRESIIEFQENEKKLKTELAEAEHTRDLYVRLKRGQTERANEIEARALELLKERDDLQSKLAQVEQERNEALQRAVSTCKHPNTYPLSAASRRCHDCGAQILL